MVPASWPTSQWIPAIRALFALKMHRIAKVNFCDAHRTAQIARFTSWVAEAHRIATLHREPREQHQFAIKGRASKCKGPIQPKRVSQTVPYTFPTLKGFSICLFVRELGSCGPGKLTEKGIFPFRSISQARSFPIRELRT